MITKTYDLDMHSGGVPVIVHLSQYDEDFSLVFNLYSSVGTFTVESGTTAAIRGTKKDGMGYSVDATLDVSNKKVTVTGDQQMTAVAGRQVFELTLTKSDKELNTANFILDVERAALDKDTLASESVIKELVNVIDRTNEIIAAAEQAESAVEAATALVAETDANADRAESAATSAEGYASQAQEAYDNLDDVIAEKTEDAIGEITEAYEECIEDIQEKGEQIAQIATDADEIAAQALQTANAVSADLAEVANKANALGNKVSALELSAENYVDNGYVENGVAYFEHNGTVLFEITGIGGGGGGGGGNNAVLTVANTSGWLSKTIASGGECEIEMTWSSIEDNIPTGNGTLKVTNNGIVKATSEIQQGLITVDVSPYLSAGSNIIKMQISDVYGNNRTINYSITVVELSISSSFDTSTVFQSVISFPYTPVGAVDKTVYFYLDGVLFNTYQTAVSGRQLTQTIPAQSHGAHTLRVYFEAEINQETVRSNELYYEFISVQALNNTVIIASSFNLETVEQYGTIQIPFMVYDPTALTASVEISVDGTVVSTQTVDRSMQSYAYRADDDGELEIEISSGTTTKTFEITVTESQIDVEPETENLVLYLSAQGRSNNEAEPGTWTYGTGAATIACEFEDFNFVSDGWQTNADGITALRVSGDARLTIPYQPFARDFRGTGKTIEIEFATRNILDYDATILSCMSEGRGLEVTAQRASLTSEQSSIATQYKEDEHVRIAFVAEKRNGNRLLFIYINGIASGVVQYPTDDDFSQTTPVDITVGSSDCTVDLYCIRVYDNDLTRHQIVTNWIADTQIGAEMLNRYTHNNVYDAYGNIVIAKLPADLPYLILSCDELPQYKGDKKTCSGSFVNPELPAKSFTFTGAQIDVQGTSSQYYPRKNYKIKFKNGFVMTATGVTSETYAMNADAVPTDTFTMKADVASSEGANNVELVRLYNDACPYKTPAQLENRKVRQGIDGFPIVIYWNDTMTDTTTFLGKANFNNDKGTEEVFGFVEGDESWETLNNTSDRVLWKSADYSGSDWLNDFEARYPDEDPAYEDPSQLAEFAEWIVTTDTTQATGDALSETYTDVDGNTHTVDNAAYRLAKFRTELGNYCEVQSALFYYLFTELFLMVDSRAKNSFPSFMGGVINE